MTEWIMQLIADQQLFRNLCFLANCDSTPWDYALDGTDCEYINIHNGITYRVNCDPSRKRCFIDDEPFFLTEKEAKLLCHLISMQLGRLKMKEKAEEIETINNTFQTAPMAS
jgi:hypothetical protein